jgi:hypothetical protein
MLMFQGQELRTDILTRDRCDLDVLSKSQSRTEHVKRGQREESVKCDVCAGASYRVLKATMEVSTTTIASRADQ